MTVAFLTAACMTQEVAPNTSYVLVTGRRLPYLYAISLDAALSPANNGTPNAIIARNKVALLGDSANLAISEDGNTAYIVNHHGGIDNSEFTQHGGRGQIAVMDVNEIIKPENDRTANALRQHIDSGAFGAVGILLLPDIPPEMSAQVPRGMWMASRSACL